MSVVPYKKTEPHWIVKDLPDRDKKVEPTAIVKKEKEEILPSKFGELFKLALQKGFTESCSQAEICPGNTVGKMMGFGYGNTHKHISYQLGLLKVFCFPENYRFRCGNCKHKNLPFEQWGELDLSEHLVNKHINPQEYDLPQIIDLIILTENSVKHPEQTINLKIDSATGKPYIYGGVPT